MIFVCSTTADGNMSLMHGDPREVLENRKKFFKKNGIQNIAEITQVHGNRVVVADKTTDPEIEADGLITNRQGLYLMIKLADCMAIGFYDRKQKAIGLAHAGSKGLERRIIKTTIDKLIKEFKINPKDLTVKISPSIGPCHYKINIWQEAEKQLIESGILEENIENPKDCTYENKDYFSHRRSDDTKTKEGRFVTILGLQC